jgi:hypothetical protein
MPYSSHAAALTVAALALTACGGMPRNLPPLEQEIVLVDLDPVQVEFVAALKRRIEQERCGDFVGQYEDATDLIRKELGPAEVFETKKKLRQPFQVLSFRPDHIPNGDQDWTEVSGCGWTRNFLFRSKEKLQLMLFCEWDGRRWDFGFFSVMGPMGQAPWKCR